MNRIRSFVPLGSPQNAIKLVGNLSEFTVSPIAQIMAVNKTQSEMIVGPSADKQTCTLTSQPAPDNREWLVKNDVILAQRGNQTVVAASGGLYRVDIGFGSHFICDPAKIMGTLGPVNARIVFAESRFDHVKAWSKVLWRSSSHLISQLYNRLVLLLSRIPVPSAVSDKYLDVMHRAREAVPPNTKTTLSQLRQKSSQAASWTATKLYYWTHSAKLKIEGPTSVLIRP